MILQSMDEPTLCVEMKMRKTQEGWLNCVDVFKLFLSVFDWSKFEECECTYEKKNKKRHKTIYTSSSHKMSVV